MSLPDGPTEPLRHDTEPLRYDTVSFLSDYGHQDEFVGVVHSVIRQLEPRARVIDITHGIAPYDVRGAGLTLARSVQYLAPGVIMAVVDPGVGGTRRSVAVEVAGGAAVLLGPDNGVLAPAVGMVGGATRAVWLNDPDHQLPAHGPTFDGRDVFAPAAAHLCSGVPLEELGEVIDPAGLLPGVMPLTREEEGALVAEVLWVDRYGNAQLNVDPEELDAMGDHFEVLVDAGRRSARRATTFADITTGGIGLIVDSYGLIALAAQQASAAEDLGVGPGDPVTLRPVDGPDPAPGIPVELGRRAGGGRP
jgi:S-adenosylmethionine hydrolase